MSDALSPRPKSFREVRVGVSLFPATGMSMAMPMAMAIAMAIMSHKPARRNPRKPGGG